MIVLSPPNHPLEKTLLGVAEASLQLVKHHNIDRALQEVVKIMGASAEVDRCYIFQNQLIAGEVRGFQRVEWSAPGIISQLNNQALQGVDYSVYPEIIPCLELGEPFYGMTQDGPKAFRAVMEAQQIQSYLFLPILVKKKLWGHIGYDACLEPRSWSQSEINALQTLSSALGFYLENQQLGIELEDKHQQFELALKGSKDGIWDMNLRTGATHVSERWKEMFGYDQGVYEWTYDFWLSLIHPDDQVRVEQNLSAFLERKHGTNDLEYRMRHGDGHYLWVLSRSAAEWNEAGEPIRIGGSDTDITSRKIHEQVLAENERQYRNLVNNLREVVFESDADGKLTFLNSSWERLTGYSIEESIGVPGTHFLADNAIALLPDIRAKMLQRPEEYTTAELQYRHKNGRLVWAEVKARRLIAPDGSHLGSTGTLVDITARKKAEADTARAIEKEKELMELRSRFILMASHEFRTPLATIQSSLDILRIYLQTAEIELRQKCDKHFEKMSLEIQRVGDLMNDVLLLGKMQAGKTKLQLKSCRLEELIPNLIAHHFSFGKDPRIPVFSQQGAAKNMRIDEQLISHCIMNLLSNALKFSMGCPPPHIQLLYKRNKALIKVTDFGIGIKPNEKKQIFEPFFRGSNVDQITGSGLGLVVVKEFIDLHQGTIYFTSSPSNGTTFTIEIPYV